MFLLRSRKNLRFPHAQEYQANMVRSVVVKVLNFAVNLNRAFYLS
jgi:hypothetical protein